MKGTKRHALLIAVAVSAVTIGSSIVVVRLSNSNRSASPGVRYALERIRILPESSIQRHFDPQDFNLARSRFADSIESGNMHVDSVRQFYQSYALWMRDGRWDDAELVELGAALGVSRP